MQPYKIIGRALWVAATVLCVVSAPAARGGSEPVASLPQVPLPDGFTGQWIAEDLRLNGVRASLRSFRGPGETDRVVAHYRDAWQRGAGAVVRRHGDWRVVATRDQDHFLSVHVHAMRDGVEGVVVVSEVPDPHTAPQSGNLPVPPSWLLLGRQEFVDRGRRAETVTLLSRQNVTGARIALVSAFERNGWRVVRDTAAQTLPDGYVLELRNGRRYARVFIARHHRWDRHTLAFATAFETEDDHD